MVGCVFVIRLFEYLDILVLFLEVGGLEEDNFVIWVFFVVLEFQNSEVDWVYRIEFQQKVCLGMDRQVRILVIVFYCFLLYLQMLSKFGLILNKKE